MFGKKERKKHKRQPKNDFDCLGTVTFLKYKELMDFYNFKFAEDEKNMELTRDMFCFMAFTSLRYSDLENLKKANVFDDHIEICTKKTHDKLSIPLTIHAKEIIDKY